MFCSLSSTPHRICSIWSREAVNGGVIPDIAIFESLLTNDKLAQLVRSVNIIQTNWAKKNLGMYFF